MNFLDPWWYVVLGAEETRMLVIWYVVPGAGETQMFVIYPGIVLGSVGIVAAAGSWMLKTWSFWLTIVISVLTILLNVPALALVPFAGLLALIAVQTIGFGLVIVLLALPTSRHAFAASS